MKKFNKKGFTIVELVIVIAVIAILAAVLIPTFSSVINKSKKSAATSAFKNALEIVLADEDAASMGSTDYLFVKDGYYAEYTGNALGATTKGTAPTTYSKTPTLSSDTQSDLSKTGVTVKIK